MLRARRRPLCEGSNAIDVSELNTATTNKRMNTMFDFRSSWIQPTKVHRRSLLAAVASIAAGFNIAPLEGGGGYLRPRRGAGGVGGQPPDPPPKRCNTND